MMVGSEGTLGVVLSAKLNLVPLPAAKAVHGDSVRSLLESLAATPVILRHRPSAVEVMDKSILDHTRQSAALEALRQSFIDGDPARCSASSSTTIAPRTFRRGCTRSNRICARTSLAIAITTRSTSRRRRASGACEKRGSGCRWP